MPEEIGALLQSLRLERGWGLQRTVRELHDAARAAGFNVGANKHMLSKWENGKKRPSPQYRWLLAKVYEVPPAMLGTAGTTPVVSAGPASRLAADIGLDEGEDEMQRRALLRNAIGLTGAAALAPALGALGGTTPTERVLARRPVAGSITGDVLEHVEALGERYRALYYSIDPPALVGPVNQHLRLAEQLLDQAPAGRPVTGWPASSGSWPC